MSLHNFQSEDLFIIPHSKNTYILYAPLRRALMKINPALVIALQKYLKSDSENLTEHETDMLTQLSEASMFQGKKPEAPLYPKGMDFTPHEVTLFLTSRCNLRCTYCYAEAGKKQVDMPWPVAKAAIDLVSDNALKLGSPMFAVGFHGGGEPTVAWKSLTQCVDYAKEKAEHLGLEVQTFAASNGLLSQKQREYIVQNFSTINISLDGPKDIQDKNRPKVGGSGSWDEISETIRYFKEKKFEFGFRATITEATVKRIPEIVECFHQEFRPSYLHLEPAWACGRCLTSGESPPEDDDFIEYFLQASKIAEKYGMPIHYSGARLDTLTSKFCAAPGDNFTVLPEGIVTSCYEMTEKDTPGADVFHYGFYNRKTDKFEFDQEQIDRLRKLTVDEFEHCSDCFCKWHCAGDCLSKVFQENGSWQHRGSSRCQMNRTLTKHQLINTINKNQQIISSQEENKE